MWFIFTFSSYKCASMLCLPAVLFDLVSLTKKGLEDSCPDHPFDSSMVSRFNIEKQLELTTDQRQIVVFFSLLLVA